MVLANVDFLETGGVSWNGKVQGNGKVRIESPAEAHDRAADLLTQRLSDQHEALFEAFQRKYRQP